MPKNPLPIGNSLRRIIVAAIACLACSSGSVRVITEGDAAALQHLKTFSLSAGTPDASQIVVAGTNSTDRVGGAVMDMDPMLETSLVGRAIYQDIANAFVKRGYQSADATPDFHVAYYAGTGRVVDTRGSAKAYHVGQKITTETYEYPAGTIVIDVVNAKSDSLVWRGIGVAEIPKDPKDYARAVQATVNKIVEQFPKAT
jgi:hypothetical protein